MLDGGMDGVVAGKGLDGMEGLWWLGEGKMG